MYTESAEYDAEWAGLEFDGNSFSFRLGLAAELISMQRTGEQCS